MESTGNHYSKRSAVDQFDSEEKERLYKNYWDYIDNISIDLIKVSNNKDDIILKEKLKLNARAYARKIENKLLVPLNAFHRITTIPDINENRTNPIVQERAYFYKDNYEINLPAEYKIESIPESINLITPFGTYKTSVEKISDSQVIFKREFQLNNNSFEAEKYNDFRDFMRAVKKRDQQKLIAIKQLN